MKISYGIIVCNEIVEIKKLLPVLINHKDVDDEIVVIYEEKNGNDEVLTYLNSLNSKIKLYISSNFHNDFSQIRNELVSYCDGDYIFHLDPDEMVSSNLIVNVKTIISENLEIDLFYVPRINTVDGITREHISKWRWNLDKGGRINFPDFQGRIHKKNLKWEGKVHERVVGAKYYSFLPLEDDFCLEHHKTIERQEHQNNLYDSI